MLCPCADISTTIARRSLTGSFAVAADLLQTPALDHRDGPDERTNTSGERP